MVIINEKSKRKNSYKGLWCIILMLCILWVTPVSALDFNIDNYKTYDKVLDKIELYDSALFGEDSKLAEYTLIYNTNQCLINCYAEGKVTLYESGKLFSDERFIDDRKREKNLEHTILIGRYYNKTATTYEDVCVENIAKNGTTTNCNVKETGERITDIQDVRWSKYYGETIDAGNYEWKIEGKKDIDESIDWIVSAFGEEFTEWAWWNNNWFKRKPITVSGGTGNLTNFTVMINVTYDEMQSDFEDIRFVDGECSSSQDDELYYEFDNNLTDIYAMVWVKVADLNPGSLNDTICMYYNNSAASDGQNPKMAWDEHYLGVWHMNQVALPIIDSKGNYNLTKASGSPGYNYDGMYGNAIDFELDQGECFSTGGDGGKSGAFFSSLTTGYGFFVEAWSRPESIPHTTKLIGTINTDGNRGWGIVESHNNGYGASIYGSSLVSFYNGGDLVVGGWNYNTLNYDGTDWEVCSNITQLCKTSATPDTINTVSLQNLSVGCLGLDEGAPAGYLDGTVDEVRISNGSIRSSDWINRSYTNTNISLFTFGSSEDVPTLFSYQHSPANDAAFINSSVVFVGSANETEGTVINNLSLFVDDVLTYTNDTSSLLLSNVSLKRIVNGLSIGSHNWSVEACDVNNDCEISSTRDFSIKLFEINSQTFNGNTTEGARENYLVNFTYNLGALQLSTISFIWNATVYSAIFEAPATNNVIGNATIIIPNLDVPKLIPFYWNVTFSDGTVINSTVRNQKINIVSVDNCTEFSNVIYNFTMFDEETKTKLDNTTMEIQFNVFDVTKTVQIINFSDEYKETNPVTICINGSILPTVNYSIESVVKYYANDSGVEYATEYHNILKQIMGNQTVPNNIKLYDLKASDSTDFQLTFRNADLAFAPNIIVQVYRQYIADNDFKLVEAPLTDTNGQTVLHLVRNDVLYNLIMVNEAGEIVGSFNRLTAFCNDYTIGQCYLNLDLSSSIGTFYDYETEVGVTFTNPTYSNSTGIVSYSFIVNDLSTKTISTEIIRNNAFGNRTVCTNSLTSASGTLNCNVTSIISTDRYLFIYTMVDGELISLQTIDLEGDDFNFGTVNGAFYAFLFILFLITMFMEDKKILIISLIIGWAAVLSFGLMKGALVGSFSAGIWLIVSGVIILWKLNKEEVG